MEKLEKYSKSLDYSYSFGAFPTFELVKNKSKYVKCILTHSKLVITEDIEKLFKLCREKNIDIHNDDKTINKIADKENCFIVGVFDKFSTKNTDTVNLVLVNPSDMGNMGTIMRTSLGFDIKSINIVRPCVDVFNPKVIRASMGAIFSLDITEFDTLDDYLQSNNNKKFFFMLNGKKELGKFVTPTDNYDLIFGNEGSGLPSECIDIDESVVIRHSHDIDSLNLPISVGMAIFEFRKSKF